MSWFGEYRRKLQILHENNYKSYLHAAYIRRETRGKYSIKKLLTKTVIKSSTIEGLQSIVHFQICESDIALRNAELRVGGKA
jgi:hypothetical protein